MEEDFQGKITNSQDKTKSIEDRYKARRHAYITEIKKKNKVGQRTEGMWLVGSREKACSFFLVLVLFFGSV